MSNLLTRILVAAVAIPVALAIVWFGGLPLAILVIVAAVLATRELFDLAEKTGVRPLRGSAWSSPRWRRSPPGCSPARGPAM